MCIAVVVPAFWGKFEERESVAKPDLLAICGQRARAVNYASSLLNLERFEEAQGILRSTVPVARRALGDNNEATLKIRGLFADALYFDPAATRDDLRESVETYEDAGQIARRVLGDAHPLTEWIEDGLQDAQDVLYARGLP